MAISNHRFLNRSISGDMLESSELLIESFKKELPI